MTTTPDPADRGAPRGTTVTHDTTDAGHLLIGDTWELWLPTGRAHALVADRDGTPWCEPLLAASVDTSAGTDETLSVAAPTFEHTDDGIRILVEATSTRWDRRRLVIDCRRTTLAWSVEVKGQASITDLHLLGSHLSGDIDWGTGFHRSGASFAGVWNPEPWGRERRVIPAGESTSLDVVGTSLPGKRHWLATPPPLCLAMTRTASPTDPTAVPDGPWLGIGVAASLASSTFTGVHYEAEEGAWSLRLAHEGHCVVDGHFASPQVVLYPGMDDPATAIATQADDLRARGLAPPIRDEAGPAWWTEPIFCGWGQQCLEADVVGGHPGRQATAANYDTWLAALESHGVVPGTVAIDDKWQVAYGTNEVDTAKWPDLSGWIARRHDQDQRVLLWWKAWDPEGLPPQECVRAPDGSVLAADPTNPAYEARLRAEVARMLGPDGYGADGFKVDFTARTPSGHSLQAHGPEWGINLLHHLLAILYDAAKATKPDALVITQTPNPQFVDVTDMLRLNDVNTGTDVVAQMTHRATVARAACPGVLVDTDNWPMPDGDAFRAFVARQPELGVPSLYFATDLPVPGPAGGPPHADWAGYREARGDDVAPRGPASVPMEPRDIQTIQQAWHAWRARRQACT